MRIAIEGWKALPHSYSCVAQAIAIEFGRLPMHEVCFEELPGFQKEWRPHVSVLAAEDADILERLPSRHPDQPMDVVLRISFPYDLTEDSDARFTVIFGTAEYGCVPSDFIRAGQRLSTLSDSVHIATCSRWSEGGFLQSGVAREKISVIPLGYNPDVFFPQDVDSRGPRGDTVTFLNVGALTQNKNIVILLKALAAVAQRKLDVRLVIKGVDSLYASNARLRQAAKQLTQREIEFVQTRVRYCGGSMPPQQVAGLMRAADIYVSPYLAEAFNLPVLEALACGLPVICTAGGPTDEFAVGNCVRRIPSRLVGRTGHPGQVELEPELDQLVECMRMAAADAAFRQSAKTQGPAAVRHLTWRSIADDYLRLFNQLLGNRAVQDASATLPSPS